MVKETREATNLAVRFAAALLGLVSTFGASSPLWAKGRMVRIEISGGTLISPLQITDEQRLEEFTFWDGPGNNGVTLQRYEVSFYWMGCPADSPVIRDGKHYCAAVPTLAYVVFYEYDASSKRGFVYLPDEDAPRGDGGMNSGTIYRGPGVAGHWFRATTSWADFVGPLIAKAPHRSR
jgi:hypothetical protein